MGSFTDKLKGKLKKAEGQATGDKVREGQGWAEEKKADAEGAVERAADRLDRKIDELQRDSDKPRRP